MYPIKRQKNYNIRNYIRHSQWVYKLYRWTFYGKFEHIFFKKYLATTNRDYQWLTYNKIYDQNLNGIYVHRAFWCIEGLC